MNAAIEEKDTPSLADLCTVVVIYDNSDTRARALKVCDYLVGQIWGSVELDFHWWRTDFLKDKYMARAAATHAVDSDFLIVARSSFEISPTLETWFEDWIDQHRNREGALIDLTTQTVSNPSSQQPNILREIARRGRFDYLTAAREPADTNTFGSTNVTNSKSTLIDDRLSHSYPPSHFGLNE